MKLLELFENEIPTITVYHGTNKQFDVLRPNSFVTTNKDFAKDYGAMIKKYAIDPRANIFDIDDKKNFEKLLDKCGDLEDPYDGSIITSWNDYINIGISGSDTWELLENYFDTVRHTGYDAMKIYEGGRLNYMIFNPSILKEIP